MYLPDFMESRLRPVIEFGYPPPEEINAIVKTTFPRIGEAENELLDELLSLG